MGRTPAITPKKNSDVRRIGGRKADFEVLDADQYGYMVFLMESRHVKTQ
jgi:hypothetical protein